MSRQGAVRRGKPLVSIAMEILVRRFTVNDWLLYGMCRQLFPAEVE